jgi:uncharacterized protein (UPF0305 family)
MKGKLIMKTSKLLLKLKKDAELYKEIVKAPDKSDNSINSIMSRYNYENFQEIFTSSINREDEDVDDFMVEDLKIRIDNYFSLYAPEDEAFKEFIKIISTYLVFVAKKPLHPSGTVFEDGSKVYKGKDSYICTGKRKFMTEELSLCRYCICRF